MYSENLLIFLEMEMNKSSIVFVIHRLFVKLRFGTGIGVARSRSRGNDSKYIIIVLYLMAVSGR